MATEEKVQEAKKQLDASPPRVEMPQVTADGIDLSSGVIPLGMREKYPNAGMYVSEALREQKVDIAFGVFGGHIWELVDEISRAGIKTITVGHEQNAVYAAEAYSKITRRPGVAFATAGPGVTNCVSPVMQAYLSCSPMVLLNGGNAPEQDGAYAIQVAWTEEVMGKITKWSKRLTSPAMFKHWITKAFKDCMAYPKGPIALEFGIGALRYTPIPPTAPAGAFGEHSLYKESWYGDKTGEPNMFGGAPDLIEKAVRMLYEAKHPLFFAADGVHWSDGGAELLELAELARVPVSTRRVTRGAVPEDHPLWLSNRIVNRVIKDSDLVIPMGMKVSSLDNNYGKTWPKCIQINESHEHIWTFLKTDLVVIGTIKVVLQQMIDCIKANGYTPPPEREEWCNRISKAQQQRDQELADRAEKYKDHTMIHHGYLSKAITEVMEAQYEGKNRIIMDGFSISGFFPPFLHAKYSAQYLDCSEMAGVGHGIGMAIGAAFADLDFARKYPVIAMMGDAGMHNAGMDIETASRHNLPIVYVVTNNSGWLTAEKYLWYGKNWEAMGPQDHGFGHQFLEKIRYDRMFQEFGCHGELVEKHHEIRPAMERALRFAQEKSMPAVVNCIMDPSLANPVVHTSYPPGYAHIPWEELPKRGKAIRRNVMKYLPWDAVGVPPMPMPDPWDPVTDEETEL